MNDSLEDFRLRFDNRTDFWNDLMVNWTLSNISTFVEFRIQEEPLKPYYGKELSAFREKYVSVHGYISVIVCLFGILANVLNIIVLTRKDMISPTNAILTGLAVADVSVMSSYLPFAIHNYVRVDQSNEDKFSYGWAVFTLFHAHFTVVFHTVSTWSTVVLAVWRFLSVGFPANNVEWCNMSRAKLAITLTYLNCAVFCLPVYLTFQIHEVRKNGEVTYHVGFSRIAERRQKLLKNVNFWIFSVLTKLIPCVLLTGLSFGLIRVLYEADTRKRRLKNRSDGDKSCDRTTRMLLAVLLLFLVTEFPSGILALLSGILGNDFYANVYQNFGEVMDFLALINSAINFILYCSMSRQFRDTFTQLFTPKIVTKWVAVPSEPATTCETTFM